MLRARHGLVLVEPQKRPSATVDLADTARRLATAFVLAEAGWLQTSTPATADVLITDRCAPEAVGATSVVLVIHLGPIACRRAVDAFTAGCVHAVVEDGVPDQVPVALDLLQRGVGTVSARVLASARTFPTLRPRLEQTLDLVLRGHSNRAIARAICTSEATAKRDVAELLRLFDAPNRLALAATAASLGVRADPDDRPHHRP